MRALLDTFNELNVCPGNPDFMLTEEQASIPAFTARRINHQYDSCLVLSDQKRCGPCSIHRSSLARAAKANQKSDQGGRDHVPYQQDQHLPWEELENRFRTSKVSLKTMKKRIITLENRIEKYIKDHHLPFWSRGR